MMLNNYRSKRFGEKHFLTTDHGDFCVLSEDEFKAFRREQYSPDLKYKLLSFGVIIEDSNIDEIIEKTRRRNSFLFQGTSLHIMVLTLRCNMNCVYCHASSVSEGEDNHDMSSETARKTVDFIFNSPSEKISIEFQGGEPLLNWEVLKEVVEYSLEKNKDSNKDLKITLVTNMSLMDEDKMNYLIDNNVGVCTSLDGPKELHDANRIFNKSNYDDVISWIKRFNDEYKKRGVNNSVNALVTITRKSLDYPKEIVDEYVDLGLKNIHLRFLNNLGVAKKAWSSINYSEKEFLDFWSKAIDYINDNNLDITERTYSVMRDKVSKDVDPNYLELRTPCGAAIGQLAYSYDGKIFTCDEARMLDDDLFMLGTVDDEFKDVVTCDKACAVTNASINDQFMCDNCVYKPYCGLCPVCNYAEQGSVIAKVSETSRCKIYMKQFDKVVRENFIKEI